ncbi:LuxR family transcriptional regulator [Roseibium sp. M-1]
MQHVFETFLTQLSSSADKQDFCEAMIIAVREFEINLFAYIYYSDGKRAEPHIITNYPQDWAARYRERNYHRIDPVVLKMETQPGTFSWPFGDHSPGLTAEVAVVLKEAGDYGIGRGLTIPIHDRFQKKAAVTFAAAAEDVRFEKTVQHHRQALQLMATCFHIHARRLLSRAETVDGIVLTKRELECLQWAMRGKSAGDTAEILGIKRRTVVFHLENVRRKFKVRTVAQAITIVAASRSDLI